MKWKAKINLFQTILQNQLIVEQMEKLKEKVLPNKLCTSFRLIGSGILISSFFSIKLIQQKLILQENARLWEEVNL